MKPIPRRTIYRLSVYLRSLHRLQENHVATVSSDALAKAACVKPTQLRKDLGHLGPVGKRGLGYPVDVLVGKLTAFLGTNRFQPVIIVGMGNLGTALFSYKGFEKAGFEIIAAFDNDSGRARGKGLSVKIQPMEELAGVVKKRSVKMAILTVPGTAAQEVANQLVAAGITAILNFAPVILLTPESVIVNNVNLAIELENLAYFIQ
ncbi:MAG: redox-sensing transcriptional repressor Rex [Verrucomicrobia bacterium]|nr:redox-sensing transcriptional repressor Rex [Verrucomicrobiota bacterium]